MTQLRLLLAVLIVLSMSLTAQAQQRVRRNVEIDWEPVPDASLYEVQVVRVDDKKKKPLSFKTKEPNWAATIKPGIYKMQLRSFDDRGVPGDWSEPTELTVKLPAVIGLAPDNNQVVPATSEKEHSLDFKWEVVPGATKYKFSAKSVTGDWKYEKEVEGTSLTLDVPVGESLDWTVHGLDPQGEVGDQWETAQTVEIQGPALDKPSISKPISEYVQEIQWSAPKHAKNYSYTLDYYNPKTKQWESVTKEELGENTLKLDTSRKTGKYRIGVQALGDRRRPSSVASLDFKMRGGFRDPAAIEDAILRDSITKPTNFYFIGSYFISQVKYDSSYYDLNARSSFDALGSTGRLGFGYQNPKAKWGTFGIVDMSLFNISGDQFTFSSIEAHLTRKTKMGHGGVLLLGGGVYTKELPIVRGSQSLGYTGAGKVRNIGPHVGFTYWQPLSDRFGLQANGRVYYSIGGSSPAGGGIESAVSYQAGVLGSYRLSSAWMSYAGYAYRADKARFDSRPGSTSFAQPGQVNQVNFQGHFLNLMFEYSF